MLAFLDWTEDPAKVGADACGKVWCLSVQKTELERAVTLRSGNDESLRESTLSILPVVIARVNVVWRVHVVAGGAPLMLSKEFLKHLGCHIHLGRGHLFFEKLCVRAEVKSKQSPHWLLPLTNVGLQGQKIPAEIQPDISSDECAICCATCDNTKSSQKVFVDRVKRRNSRRSLSKALKLRWIWSVQKSGTETPCST